MAFLEDKTGLWLCCPFLTDTLSYCLVFLSLYPSNNLIYELLWCDLLLCRQCIILILRNAANGIPLSQTGCSSSSLDDKREERNVCIPTNIIGKTLAVFIAILGWCKTIIYRRPFLVGFLVVAVCGVLLVYFFYVLHGYLGNLETWLSFPKSTYWSSSGPSEETLFPWLCGYFCLVALICLLHWCLNLCRGPEMMLTTWVC